MQEIQEWLRDTPTIVYVGIIIVLSLFIIATVIRKTYRYIRNSRTNAKLQKTAMHNTKQHSTEQFTNILKNSEAMLETIKAYQDDYAYMLFHPLFYDERTESVDVFQQIVAQERDHYLKAKSIFDPEKHNYNDEERTMLRRAQQVPQNLKNATVALRLESDVAGWGKLTTEQRDMINIARRSESDFKNKRLSREERIEAAVHMRYVMQTLSEDKNQEILAIQFDQAFERAVDQEFGARTFEREIKRRQDNI